MDSLTRFRFRDPTNSSSSGSDGSSLSSNGDDDESMLQSMTGKGIKRLCSELLELKKASDEEFHRSVYSNYSTFVRIFEQVGTMDNELMKLKQHVLTQRKLVRDVMDGMDLEMLTEESEESIIDETEDLDIYPQSKLEVHMISTLETLDILMSEHRLDEALSILVVEIGTLNMIQFEEDPELQVLVSYNSAILERKTTIADQFALVADHPRVDSPEFHRAILGLQKLGEDQRATQLLLNFYRSRLAKGIYDLQHSKQSLHGTFIRELAKLVFSVIAQGARGYEALHGEKIPYTSEFIQWTRDETKVFACYFRKYVKSITEINGSLSTVVEAVQFAMSFCSLLESQSIMLQPCLIKQLRPCIEDVLTMHIDHVKKVIAIFSATDGWVLGRYLISGILKEQPSPMVIGHQLEYSLLTSSGRKFITMMQAIVKEASPLIILQMELSILNGLMDLFREYNEILIRAIPGKESVVDKAGSRIIVAQALSQQLSVIANSSAVSNVLSSTARSIFKDNDDIDDQPITLHAVGSQRTKLDDWITSIHEMTDGLRDYFCEQLIHRVMSLDGGSRLLPETYVENKHDTGTFKDSMPSAAFQVLFQELRQLEKLGKDIFVGTESLVKELLEQLVGCFFVWLSNNHNFWTVIEDRPIVDIQQCRGLEQFVLDMQLLVETARLGGYFSDTMLEASVDLAYRMETAFVFAGWAPMRDTLTDEWLTHAANEAISKLLEIENAKLSSMGGSSRNYEEDPEDDTSSLGYSEELEDGLLINVPKSDITVTDGERSKLEVTPSTDDESSELDGTPSAEVQGQPEGPELEVNLDEEATEDDTSSLGDSEELETRLLINVPKSVTTDTDEEMLKLEVMPSSDDETSELDGTPSGEAQAQLDLEVNLDEEDTEDDILGNYEELENGLLISVPESVITDTPQETTNLEATPSTGAHSPPQLVVNWDGEDTDNCTGWLINDMGAVDTSDAEVSMFNEIETTGVHNVGTIDESLGVKQEEEQGPSSPHSSSKGSADWRNEDIAEMVIRKLLYSDMKLEADVEEVEFQDEQNVSVKIQEAAVGSPIKQPNNENTSD